MKKNRATELVARPAIVFKTASRTVRMGLSRLNARDTVRKASKKQEPYISRQTVEMVWNPDYPQDAECTCGHPYYRHFDSFYDMKPIGCKYCPCWHFQLAEE